MKIRIVFTLSLSFFLSFTSVFGQRDNGFTTDYVMGGGEEILLEDAEWFFGIGDYRRALPLFVKLFTRYPGTNAYRYYVGICYLQKTDEQAKAISYLEDAYSRDPQLVDILFYLGRAYMVNYHFDEAIGYFKLALDKKKTSPDNKLLIPRFIEQCGNAKELRSKSGEQRLSLENIGPPINTKYDEYSPLVSSDESVMVFTYKGKRSRGGLINIYGEPDPDGMYFEDIFGAYRLGNKWLDPDGLGSRINSNYHEAVSGLSPDGLSLFVYRDERGGDIHVSRRIKNTWVRPEPLPGEVNTKHYEGHASITVDERILFFVSDRPGGFGGQDLYRATLLEDETWGNIINLGPDINTPYDEDAPFIHANGELLYFSSKGHNSMGGFDIFYTTLIDGKWSKPDNIGPPVNTPNDDNFYVVSANGERAYFSSARAGGYGGQDVYVVKPGVFGKKPVLALIKGVIKNNARNIQATIRVTNTTTNEAYGDYKSNAASGNYLIALPPGYDYKLDFVLKDKVLHTENVDIENLGVFVEVQQDFELAEKKNPFIDSTDMLQNLLDVKIADIEAAKEALALEKELQDAEADKASEEITKLYLLDESGDVLMASVKDEKGVFNFSNQTMRDEYSMLLDSKDASIEEEIIVLIKDEDGNDKLITTTVILATAEEVAILESSMVLITPDVKQKTEEEASSRAEEDARRKAEEEARLKAQEESGLEAEANAKRKAVEEARLKTEEEARSKTEEESSVKANESTEALAREEAAARAETAARAKAMVEIRPKAEEEAGTQTSVDQRSTGDAKFENILFDFDKATLRAKSKKELDAIQLYLAQNNTQKIIIGGHADAVGTEKYNLKLSERRTQRAAAYLIDRGISESQLVLYAFGKTQPIAANTNSDGSDNPNGRQKNRRAEFSGADTESDMVGGKLIAFSRRVANQSRQIAGSAAFKGTFYKVQVAAYKYPKNYKHDKLDDLGQVAALNVNNITRFTLGRFNNLKEARQFKKLIVKRGTADAFITAEVDGERKYLNELNGQATLAKGRSPKPISPAAMVAYRRVMDKFGDERVEGLEFNVQVAAYQYAKNYSGKAVEALGEIRSKKLADSITRFTIGSFRTLQEAENFKKKVLNKGTNDAFVTARYNGNRILVKDLIANNFYAL